MFAERDKHYPRKSGQTSLATAVANITKPFTKINFGPSSMSIFYCISPFQFLEPGRGDDQVLQEWNMGREQRNSQPRGGPVPQDSCM